MLKIRKRFPPFDSFVFLFVVFAVFASIFGPVAYQHSLAPPDTLFPFAGGFFPDFYQYLSWIYDGSKGHILLTSRYSEVQSLRVFIHPLFPIIGYIGALFDLPPYISYLVSRIIATGIFLMTYVGLLRACIKTTALRSLSLLLFLSFSGFWTIDTTQQLFKVQEFIPWSGNFNVLYKFNLPPHHFLGLSALMLIILIFHTNRITIGLFLSHVILVILLGLLNPSILSIALTIWICAFIFAFTSIGKTLIPLQKPLIVSIAVGASVLLYHMLIFRFVLPWSVMYERMKQFDPPASFISYVLALGPMVLPALFSIKSAYKKDTAVIFLFLWAYIPFVLFMLKGSFLPINGGRLFQSYQYIPLSILSAMGIEYLMQILRIKRRIFLYGVIGSVSVLYGIIPFLSTVRSYKGSLNPVWFNVYIPKSLIDTFSFLSTSTPKESVVLASEFTSQMIPAFSHNRTILARDDIVFDYDIKRDRALAFFNGMIDQSNAEQFLKTYNISYIIYGIDAPSYRNIPASYSAFLTPVYSHGPVVLAKVNMK